MNDGTDRTIKLTIRTTGPGARILFKQLANWIEINNEHRSIDMFEQHVDGVPMEKEDDNTKELQREESLAPPGRH